MKSADLTKRRDLTGRAARQLSARISALAAGLAGDGLIPTATDERTADVHASRAVAGLVSGSVDWAHDVRWWFSVDGLTPTAWWSTPCGILVAAVPDVDHGEDAWMNLTDAAELLDRHRSTVHTAIQTGRLRAREGTGPTGGRMVFRHDVAREVVARG